MQMCIMLSMRGALREPAVRLILFIDIHSLSPFCPPCNPCSTSSGTREAAFNNYKYGDR